MQQNVAETNTHRSLVLQQTQSSTNHITHVHIINVSVAIFTLCPVPEPGPGDYHNTDHINVNLRRAPAYSLGQRFSKKFGKSMFVLVSLALCQ